MNFSERTNYYELLDLASGSEELEGHQQQQQQQENNNRKKKSCFGSVFGNMLRSEEMCSGTLVLPVEKARHFLDVLGQTVNLQFCDSFANSVVLHRPFRKYMQRIEEVERIIRFLVEECRRRELEYYPVNLDGNGARDYLQAPEAPVNTNNTTTLDLVEGEVTAVHQSVQVLLENHALLVEGYNTCIEEKHVLEATWRSSNRGLEDNLSRTPGQITDNERLLGPRANRDASDGIREERTSPPPTCPIM